MIIPYSTLATGLKFITRSKCPGCGQDSPCPKSSQDMEETTHERTFAHALPTFSTADPDLALIVEVWDRLMDECKQQMIAMARAILTGEGRDSGRQ